MVTAPVRQQDEYQPFVGRRGRKPKKHGMQVTIPNLHSSVGQTKHIDRGRKGYSWGVGCVPDAQR